MIIYEYCCLLLYMAEFLVPCALNLDEVNGVSVVTFRLVSAHFFMTQYIMSYTMYDVYVLFKHEVSSEESLTCIAQGIVLYTSHRLLTYPM